MQDLIIIKQLPQIEEHLKELSIEVEQKVENAKSLICTEENVKTIKEVRADLNKEFKEVEKQRTKIWEWRNKRPHKRNRQLIKNATIWKCRKSTKQNKKHTNDR